jgi:hypothetical protein
MTLDEFLISSLKNSYVDYPGFDSLYLRRGDIGVHGEKLLRCGPTVHVANMTATTPFDGAFTRLVEDLASRGFAVYVECVLDMEFAEALLRMGFTQINRSSGLHFLKNHEGKLTPWLA